MVDVHLIRGVRATPEDTAEVTAVTPDDDSGDVI
jgi:hypothetical protein